jgi:phosphohistidine swiveling domain-containing protein
VICQLIEASDAAVVGGKAINLGELLRAGLPVPDGFVLTTAAYRACSGTLEDPALRTAIVAAWRDLGAPVVAVRSSATAEDTAGASMAGQYETVLDVRSADDLLAAVQRCWDSLKAQRVATYLERHGIARDGVAMAVVVQELVPARVAGVLFTADPRTAERTRMLLEASWGLGESVVSGAVQPDTLVLDHASGDVLATTLGTKDAQLVSGSGQQAVTAADRARCCLDAAEIAALWRLGRAVERHYGQPMDLEWAIAADGVARLLQARAITTLEAGEDRRTARETVRRRCAEALAAGTPGWVRHNLAETLPRPTPLTWSVIRPFMSGSGGYGTLLRWAGFTPSPAAMRDGVLDLLGGRIHLDLGRAGGMFLADFPFAYDLERLRRDPDAAQRPPDVPTGSWRQRLAAGRALAGVPAALTALATRVETELEPVVIPAYRAWVAAEQARDLTILDGAGLMAVWEARRARVLDDFAPWSLAPSVVTVQALAELRAVAATWDWESEPDALAARIAVAAEMDRTVAANQGLHQIANSGGDLAEWLTEHGHRAPGEFDLAEPRWHERPDAVRAMAAHQRGTEAPVMRHERAAAVATATALALRTRLPAGERTAYDALVARIRHHVRYREDGKHELMRGYALLRAVALEAGRRLGLGDAVFLLTAEELGAALATGFAPQALLAARRRDRAAEAGLVLPPLITERELSGLGEPPAPAAAGERLAAFAASPGVGRGPARIVHDPAAAGDLGEGYVLVCPSTDPAWTPLFARAAGLVLESGGSLSHGAVVARELGLPAVVVPGACTLLAPGEAVVVDGDRGCVLRGSGGHDSAADLADPRLPAALLPPPPGPDERRGLRLAVTASLAWLPVVVAYALSATEIIPAAWVEQPVLGLFDAALLPLARQLGWPWTVAVVAAGLALLVMLVQRALADAPRLRCAKQRAAALRRTAADLPADSPRRAALLAAAAPVEGRLLVAALLPLGLLLGVILAPFPWLMQRADPAAWNPRPGAVATITASLAGDHLEPLTLTLDPALTLEESTPATQTQAPVRATLEDLRRSWGADPGVGADQPWAVRAAANRTREAMLADLDAFLARPLPDQERLVWQVATPDRPGRFPVTLSGPGLAPLTLHLVTGIGQAPERTVTLADGPRPGRERSVDALHRVTIAYTPGLAPAERIFAQPFAWAGWSWQAGWLWIYLFAYLPMMYAAKWLLRVP